VTPVAVQIGNERQTQRISPRMRMMIEAKLKHLNGMLDAYKRTDLRETLAMVADANDTGFEKTRNSPCHCT
jgi:hypothetical protein